MHNKMVKFITQLGLRHATPWRTT